MLATWLSTFFSRAGHIFLLQCLDRTGEEWASYFQNSPVLIDPPLFPVWLSCLYFLPGYWPIRVYLKRNWQNTELSHTKNPEHNSFYDLKESICLHSLIQGNFSAALKVNGTIKLMFDIPRMVDNSHLTYSQSLARHLSHNKKQIYYSRCRKSIWMEEA